MRLYKNDEYSRSPTAEGFASRLIEQLPQNHQLL